MKRKNILQKHMIQYGNQKLNGAMLNYDRSHMSNLQGPAGTIPTQSRTFLSLKGYTTQYCPERMLSLEIILCSLSTLMPLIPQSFADIFITVVIRGVSVLCMPGMFPL